jgi:poly-gamma-glutamate capsule biosynthesis protein CapA/YwtB (metallophosphatase superfamily)
MFTPVIIFMQIKKFIKPFIVLILFAVSIDVYAARRETPTPKVAVVQSVQTIVPAALPVLAPQQPAEAKRTTLMFTGDINLGRCVASASIRAADYTHPFKHVAERLSTADITVGSLDGTLSDASPAQACPGSMNLIGPKNMVQGLQFAGFDVITIATNHVKDCGEKGFFCDNRSFFDTINTLSQAGIQPVGGGTTLGEARKPVVIEKQGVRFAFLAINQINARVWATEETPGVAPLSPETLEQVLTDIAAAKTVADVVIVLPQWGTEYAANPDPIQREWAREIINAGATMIVGNHPHILQPMESFSNGTAFYALGNFVFDQRQNFRREGMVVQATFHGAQLESIQLMPIDINYYTYQPSWTEDPNAQKILTRVPDLSK